MIAVDLEKVLLAVCQGCNEELSEEPCEPEDCRIRQKLEDLSATDAVRVIRCWECKHLDVVNRKELYAHCPKTNTVFLPFELDTREHFCSLGERKEGADND